MREEIRIHTNMIIDMFVPADSGVSAGKGYIIDFSVNGIAIRTNLEIDTGAEIGICSGMDGLQLNFTGKVVRKEKIVDNLNKYGLKYVGLDIIDRIRLRNQLTKWFKLQNT